MNRIIIKKFIGLSIILTTICGCNMKNTLQQESKILAKLIIFPTGVEFETYIIELKSNGTICTAFGEANELVIKQPKSYKEQKLSDVFSSLQKMVEALPKEPIAKDAKIYKGGWEFILSIPKTKKQYHGNFQDVEEIDKGVINFIRQLIKLSPIKVDMHGWS